MTVPNVSPLERAQEGVILTLSARLDTELGLIDAEAGDLTLPRPDGYFRHWVEEEGGKVLVEVVPVRASSDAAMAPVEYAMGRLTTDVVVSVGAVIRRDSTWDDETMMKVLNRYGAAFIRVLAMRHQDLEDATDTVLHVVPDGPVTYSVDPSQDPGGRVIQKVSVTFKVRLQESF